MWFRRFAVRRGARSTAIHTGSGTRLTALLLCALPSAAFGQDAAPSIPPALPVAFDTIVLTPDRSTRMTVSVLLDGKGPYPFVVDTGAERTSVSNELAATLALRSAGNARLHSVTGVTPVGLYHIGTLDMDRHRATDLRAPGMAGAHLGGLGLIGVDTLKQQRITMDFRKRTMTIAPSKTRDAAARGDDIIVKARSRAGRLVIMDATLDGARVAVILDTGSQTSLGNEALKRKLFAQRRKRPSALIELRDVIGGRMTATYTTTHALKISDFQLNALPIALADAHIFTELGFADKPAMLLGMDALALFERVTIDFRRRTARFLRPHETEIASW
jgi:predicted aspartyl protease